MKSFSPTTIDAYILNETHQFETTVLKHYANYEFRDANTAIYHFCTDTLSSLYLSTIKDRLYCDAPSSEQRRRAQVTLRIILDVLIRVLSPILPHTCDEALESLNSSTTDSVQGLPALQLQAVACDDHWDAVINFRKLVLKELETAKANGIENSLDAGIQIPNTISTAFKGELADLFGVSRVELTETDAIKVIDLKMNFVVSDLGSETRL